MANHLLATVHAQGDFSAALQWLETCGVNYPDFQREHTRIAMCQGEIVGGLRINTDTIRIGEARLKMGGIGWVTTSPRWRKRGICRVIMNDALQYMREHKYHVSLLFGIPDFYDRFGYVTSLADYAVFVDTIEATAFHTDLTVRQAKPGDIRAIQKIHVANDGDMACSIVRSAGHFMSKWDSVAKSFRVLMDDQGKVLAYFSFNVCTDHLSIEEVGVSDAGYSADVLAATGRIAADRSLGMIRYAVPPPHPFSRYLLLFRSRHEMRIARNADGMLGFISVGEALEHMIPEWENTLSQSVARDLRTEFTLIVDNTCHRIRANRGAIDIASLPGQCKISLCRADLMHLVTGYRHADDVIDWRRYFVSPPARQLFAAIFPKRTPFVWRFDRF